MDQYSRIGAYLKTLRENKKMSQEEAAENLNISARTLQRYERGEINTLDKLMTLADFYEVSLSELVTGERSNENIACGDKEKRLASFADEVAKKNMFRVYGLGFALTLLLCAIVISIQFICNGKYSPETMIIVLGPLAVMAFLFFKQERKIKYLIWGIASGLLFLLFLIAFIMRLGGLL